MKVFNWVSWKFTNAHSHSDARKENGVENTRRRSSKSIDVDLDEKYVLLDDHMVNNWDHTQDGLILAIGTLGVGSFIDDHMHHDQDATLVDHDHHDHDDDILRNIHALMLTHELEKGGINNEIEEVFSEDNIDNIAKKRVTLADLFSESSDSDSNSDPDYHRDYYNVKEVVQKEKVNTFVQEKSIHWPKKKTLIREDFRPLYVFNKLMKRMLKKRIHPDNMEGKMKGNPNAAKTNIR